MEASWQPDPTGRHHYRWWDGAAWGESVADHGVVSIERLTGPVLPVVGPAADVPTAEPTGTPAAAKVTITVSTMPRIGPPVGGPSMSAYATEPIKVGGGLGKWIALAVIVLAVVGAAIYLLAFREDGGAEGSSVGITMGELDGNGSFIFRDVKMIDGDAIRFRVEGDEDRDLVTYLIAPDQLATDHVSRYFTDYGTELGITDVDDLFSDLTDADDVLSDGDVQDAVRGYVVLQNSDQCCAGVPDADTFIATVSGSYRIVVIEADGRSSNVKIIVELLPRRLYSYSEIVDARSGDEFFTDTGFFSDSGPYEADSGS